MQLPPSIAVFLASSALLVAATVAPAAALPPDPEGGCPQPANALVITEVMVAGQSGPRFVEVLNPGKYALSLDKIVMSIASGGDASSSVKVVAFPLGVVMPQLPAGEAVAFGHVPPSKDGDAWLKLKIADLGPTFNLPSCQGKVMLEGPKGPVDSIVFAACEGGGPKQGFVLGLDPAWTDICKNDDPKVWCLAPGSTPNGTPGKANAPCDLDGDGFSGADGDCDDGKKGVFPGAAEVCNGDDDDCNGQTDEGLVAPVGTCLSDGICAGPLENGSPVAKCDGANGFVCSYPFGYESVSETLCDGFDNDCDGLTDEALVNACAQCGAEPPEVCNGKDDDCDGQTDEGAVLAGVSCGSTGVCLAAVPTCGASGAPSCVLPQTWQQTESLCDDLDNDCDGKTDEDLGLGAACATGVGACVAKGFWQCGSGGAVVCGGSAGASAEEMCGDGLDNDCDGLTDEGFGVGEQCAAGEGVCRVFGKRVCGADRRSAQCNVQPVSPGPVEHCGNELDDDCDGQTDEIGCSSAVPASCMAQGPATRAWPMGVLLLGVAGMLLLWRARRGATGRPAASA